MHSTKITLELIKSGQSFPNSNKVQWLYFYSEHIICLDMFESETLILIKLNVLMYYYYLEFIVLLIYYVTEGAEIHVYITWAPQRYWDEDRLPTLS